MLFFFFKHKTAYYLLRSLVGSEMCIRDSTLHRAAGWGLARADVVAIAVAALVSIGAYRTLTFRNDPFVRWVYQPWSVAAVAVPYTQLTLRTTDTV